MRDCLLHDVGMDDLAKGTDGLVALEQRRNGKGDEGRIGQGVFGANKISRNFFLHGVMTPSWRCHDRCHARRHSCHDAWKAAENSHFSFSRRVPAFACVRARYLNFIRTLRMHMKLKAFFFSIAAFLRSKNQSRSFSLISGLLHLWCALMTGVTVSFFRIGRCEAHDPKFPRGFCSLHRRGVRIGLGRLVPSCFEREKTMSDRTTISSATEVDLMQIVALHRLLDFAVSEALAGNVDDSVLEGVVILTRMVGRKVSLVANRLLGSEASSRDD
ncbi:hypothetical protein NBRC3222_2540 [Acetobacter pasteurianus NBRC 3222]|nr:hypothetical protein NBRC3222_2540 [Acetobacter pasteurianus NBRC 3222]